MAEVKPIESVEIIFKVVGNETFTNTWKVEDTTLDKVRIIEQVIMKAMGDVYQGLNK
jgi:hypothetical protein